jgi:DNA-binding HxlR family transcriptional regulator
MERNPSSAEELKTIRKIMEESTKFLSISGLSVVFLGLFAIAGALAAYFLIPGTGNISNWEYFTTQSGLVNRNIRWMLLIDASSVLLLCLLTAFYFSVRKARRSGKSFWSPVSKRLLISLFIPLLAGGLFALILLFRNEFQTVIPVLLIFYGLALVNASKFTYNEIFYLGISEIITGLLSAFFPAGGLLFWILGFGLIHIIYGLFLYRKYEGLSKVFESRIRLGIMSVLMVNDSYDFNSLKESLDVTDGNLASHLKALEDKGLIIVKKKFIGRKPNTSYAITDEGVHQFRQHLNALENLIRTQ